MIGIRPVPAAAALLLAAACAAAQPAAPRTGPSPAGAYPAPLSFDPFAARPRRTPAPPPSPEAWTSWRGLRVAPGDPACALPGPPPDPASTAPARPPRGAPPVRDPLTCADTLRDGAAPAHAARVVTFRDAYERGLCLRGRGEQALFALDSGNILPAPVPAGVLRWRAAHRDGWLPQVNPCWYARVRLRVHQRWGLSMPAVEAGALRRALAGCSAHEQVHPQCPPLGGG